MKKTNAFVFVLYITGLSMHQIQSLALGVLLYYEEGPKFIRCCVDQGRSFLARDGDINLMDFGSFLDESN